MSAETQPQPVEPKEPKKTTEILANLQETPATIAGTSTTGFGTGSN